MKTKKHTPDERIPADKGNDSRGFLLFFIVSFIGHLVVLAWFVILPDMAPAKKFTPSVINVSLVAIPSQGALPRSNSKATLKAPKQRVSSKLSPDSKKTVSVAPQKRKPKTSLKKKTFKSKKVIKQAISSLEKEVEDSRPPSLNEALDKLNAEAVDIMLCDINMPEMTGPELVKKVRELPSCTDMKIIMVSTESADETISDLLANGANGYITKPFTPEKFREKMSPFLN